MKKILIGTHNSGKFKELSFLISKRIKKISPNSLKIKSPKETGKSFRANSELKANYFSNYTKLPVISDDSGLCVASLKGKPGIYSARWAGKTMNFNKAIKKVYFEIKKKDKNWKNKKIKARFICALSICYLNKIVATSIGKIEGRISIKPKGKNGFGYDPIFIPEKKNKTFGEMKFLQKYKIDHRFIAFKKIKKFL